MLFDYPWPSIFQHLALGTSITIATIIAPIKPAMAQISIFPTVVELTADISGQAQAVINVNNPTDENFTATITPQPFTYGSTEGFITISDRSADLTPYLQFYPARLDIPPGTNRTIRLIIAFPEDLPPQEYRVSLVTEKLTPYQTPTGDRSAITIYGRNGSVEPYLEVLGAQWNRFERSVALIVKNAGTASARPVVNWGIYRGEQEFLVGSTSALAVITGTERNLLLQDSQLASLSPGYYQVKGNLVLDTQGNQLAQPFNETIRIR